MGRTNGELEGSTFVLELQDDIERLERNIKVFEDEEIGNGTGSFGFRYPHKVKPFQEFMRKIICRLQEMMDRLEDMRTPKYEIYRKCTNELSDVLDQYIAGTLPKDRALLLLKSKYDRIFGEVIEISKRGGFIMIDDVPDEYIKITMAINKYYMEMRSYLEYLGEESQKQETPTLSQNSESPVAKPDAAIELPINDTLEKLASQDNPVLRRWNSGKYKCKNLRRFVNEYADITGENPTKRLILDYLVKEDGEPFRESAIVTTLNSYGVTPERKKIKGRQRKETHKKDSL